MYLNDLEDEFFLKSAEGVDIGTLKMFLLMYADDIVIFANSAEELQKKSRYFIDILQQMEVNC